MPNNAASPGSSRLKVQQVHNAYLDTVYVHDYFQAVRQSSSRWANHLNFIIALGGSGGGATGFLGLVGGISWLAWVCGPLTLIAAALAIAKPIYGWDKAVELSNRMIEEYGTLSTRYRFLIENMNVRQRWTEDLEQKAESLEAKRLEVAPASFPPLPHDQTISIQNAIIKRIDYTNWWLPSE